jgi:hypothetical protein
LIIWPKELVKSDIDFTGTATPEGPAAIPTTNHVLVEVGFVGFTAAVVMLTFTPGAGLAMRVSYEDSESVS